jgi:hypothetical protein
MKGIKKYSPCVVIESTLQNLRTELIESGHDLQNLLAVDFPGADAVHAAVERIHNLLQREGGIGTVWVTAHIREDDKCRYITNRDVRAVSISILFMFFLDCT